MVFSVRRLTMLSGCIVLGLILVLPGFAIHAQQGGDVLIPTSLGPGGCYSFSLVNGNTQSQDIDKITLRILTPGSHWYSQMKAPAMWTVSLPLPETLEFVGSKPVPPAGKLLLNSICLNPICADVSTIKILWSTFIGTTPLTTDTLTITCTPLNPVDAVTARDSAGAFLLTLFNQNSANYRLDEFSIRAVTPGITIISGTNNSWAVGSSTSTSASFTKTSDDLPAGDSLSGFVLTLTNSGSATPPYLFEWSTASAGRTITQAELQLGKGTPVCDSVRLDALQRPPSGDFNLYNMTLRNTHKPSGPIDGIRLEIISTDIEFADSIAGPWSHSASSGKLREFTAVAAPLAAGDSLPQFRVSFKNPGSGNVVTLIWMTRSQGNQICRDTVTVSCPPTTFTSCDNLATLMDANCMASFRVSNRHEPFSRLNGFRIEVLPGAESIISAIAPNGWQVDSSTSSVARFSSTAGLPHGSTSLPFEIAFTSAQAGQSFTIRWSTWYNGRKICEEDRAVVCAVAPTACDTLLYSSDGLRNYTFRVTNQHLPASKLTGLSFTVRSLDSDIELVAAAGAWAADSVSRYYVHLLHQGGGIAPGAESGDIEFVFRDNRTAGITLQWCGEDSIGTLCCGDLLLVLPEWLRSDTLTVRNNPNECSTEITVKNTSDWKLPLVQLDVSINSPGREIDTAFAPPGWTTVLGHPQVVAFISSGEGLPPDSTLGGFILRLLPVPAGGAVQVSMCTSNPERVIYCQPGEIPCAAEQMDGCDSTTLDQDLMCCFGLSVMNLRAPGALVDSVYLRVLTPDVIVYQSTVESPIGWVSSGTEKEVFWSTATIPIASGFSADLFRVCFDNDAIGNADFLVEVNSFDQNDARCIDTLSVSCDQTLAVSGSPRASEFMIEANYPNPFNPTTTIAFGMGKPDFITMEILDARGNNVATLLQGYHTEGRHRIEFDASDLPSGVYFARLRSGTQIAIHAITLLQ